MVEVKIYRNKELHCIVNVDKLDATLKSLQEIYPDDFFYVVAPIDYVIEQFTKTYKIARLN